MYVGTSWCTMVYQGTAKDSMSYREHFTSNQLKQEIEVWPKGPNSQLYHDVSWYIMINHGISFFYHDIRF